MTNKKLTIILIPIAVLLFISFIYILIQANNNEKSKVYFNKSSLTNTNWEKGDNSVKVTSNKISITLNGKKIIDDKKFDIDSRTGKFTFTDSNEEIYLRSINSNYMVIWYEKADYNLNKKTIKE